MAEKLDVYDLLAAFIPGTLLVCLIPAVFPEVRCEAAFPAFPDAYAAVTLVALAVFTGHVIQAVSSVLEPGLYWTWGGPPSDRILGGKGGPRYLPADMAETIRATLAEALGRDASARSLFLYAAQLAENSGNSRVARFNALYGYHRNMLTLGLVSLVTYAASTQWGAASACARDTKALTAGAGMALCLLLWHRTRQRAVYYAREVLLTAQRVIERRSASSSSAQG